MNKILLGTTALVAGGLIAGAASAADIIPAPIPEPVDEGFTLVVSGDAEIAFAFKDTDECDDGEFNFVFHGDLRNDLIAAGLDPALVNQNVAGDDFLNGACVTLNASNDLANGENQGHIRHDDEPTWIRFDSKLSFDAETTLANGLGFAAHIEMDGHTGSVEDHWIDITGNFGMVSIGWVDNAYKQMMYTDVGRMGVAGGPDDPKAGVLISQETVSGDIGGLNDGLKIVYVTPRFSGLQLAVSFEPDDDDGDRALQRSDGQNHVVDSDDRWINVWAFGANYEASYGSHDIVIGGGFGGGDAETSHDTLDEAQNHCWGQPGDDEPVADAFGAATGDVECGDAEWWGIGGEISSANYVVGGSYSEIDFDHGVNRSHWNAGVIFTNGDWEYGVGYGEEEDEHYFSYVTGVKDEAQFVSAGVTNNLAPGVAVGAFVNWRSEDVAWRKFYGLDEIDGFAAGVATRLRF